MSTAARLKLERIDYSDLYFDTFSTKKELDKESFLKTFCLNLTGCLIKKWNKKDIIDSLIIPGKKLLFFDIINITEIEVILAGETKNIDYRLALAFVNSIDNNYIAVMSTKICLKDIFGRILFFFIKPFHKKIIKRAFVKTINCFKDN
ncbi:MAG TPA: DUF2867 domain-containing protein [Ignavibacteria bacterium]